MSNGDFAQQFQTCATGEGTPYLVARDAILAMGAAVRAQLDAKLDSSDWHEQLAAQILIGWLDNRQLFDQVKKTVGGLPSRGMLSTPVSGTFTPSDRARGLKAMGTAIVPRLLEMLLKSYEVFDTAETQAIFQTLNALRDPRSVMPLADLVGRTAPEPAQIFALGTLGTMKDPRTFQTVQSQLANQTNTAGVRAAAAVALGMFEDQRAMPVLLALLRDTTEADIVRRNAVRGLSQLGDQSASEALAALLRSEQPPEMALTLVQALGKLGGPTAIAALEETGRSHTEVTVRQAAEGARRTLA
ncbi:MAG TPA: HEAT repeat domain-containing protein [Pyrinomonadaceae bacterium]|jgi:HEAT repeat protein